MRVLYCFPLLRVRFAPSWLRSNVCPRESCTSFHAIATLRGKIYYPFFSFSNYPKAKTTGKAEAEAQAVETALAGQSNDLKAKTTGKA
jgi:hypothetical protein